jgi:hypothetical protein
MTAVCQLSLIIFKSMMPIFARIIIAHIIQWEYEMTNDGYGPARLPKKHCSYFRFTYEFRWLEQRAGPWQKDSLSKGSSVICLGRWENNIPIDEVHEIRTRSTVYSMHRY